MFMIVDLPEPDGPMIATNSPSSTDRSMPRSAWNEAAALAVDLGDAGELEQRASRGGGLALRAHGVPPAASVITCIPARRSPPVISVRWPSLEPTVTEHGAGRPVREHPDPLLAVRAVAARLLGRLIGGRGIRLETIPPLFFGGCRGPRGVKRRAALGTSSTPIRLSVRDLGGRGHARAQ